MRKLLRLMTPRNDSLISDEKFGDLLTMTLEELVGSLKIHELRLQEPDTTSEEEALLAQDLTKMKQDDYGKAS